MKENSAHGFTEGSEVPKEQDAAHSSLSVCPFCGLLPEWVNEYLQDGHFYIRCPHCHIVMKEDRRDKVIGMWNRRTELTRLRSELQQKDEVIRELIVVAQGLRNYSWTDEYTNQKYDLIIKRAFESIEKSKAKIINYGDREANR